MMEIWEVFVRCCFSIFPLEMTMAHHQLHPLHHLRQSCVQGARRLQKA